MPVETSCFLYKLGVAVQSLNKCGGYEYNCYLMKCLTRMQSKVCTTQFGKVQGRQIRSCDLEDRKCESACATHVK